MHLKRRTLVKIQQNKIIELCGEQIQDLIKTRIFKGKYYSVIFDETTDTSHSSQMTVVLRYVDVDVCEIREDFFCFINCHTENYSDFTYEPVLTGELLAKTVASTLTKCGLNLKDCVGIGTDGCSIMLGENHGAVTKLQTSLTNAIKSPCYNHALNLSISKCSSVQAVRNTIGTMKEVISFFKASPKRNNVLKYINKEMLKSLCETRWVERHDSVLNFKLSLIKLVETFDLVSQWKERDSSTKAVLLRNAISEPLFVITLCSLASVLNTTVSLSNVLQTKTLDKEYAKTILKHTIQILNEKRQNAEENFNFIFQEALKLLKDTGSEIRIPRITGRQINRPNLNTNDPQTYYRVNVYLPLLESILLDLQSRFSDETLNSFELNVVVPRNLLNKTKAEITASITTILNYMKGLPDMDNIDKQLQKMKLLSEFDFWELKWKDVLKRQQNVPDCALDAYKQCDIVIFPMIKCILQLLCTLPVSVASGERSFSALNRLKTWLRSTMGQERLNGLAMMHIHRDSIINVEKIIDKFATAKNRKLDFVL